MSRKIEEFVNLKRIQNCHQKEKNKQNEIIFPKNSNQPNFEKDVLTTKNPFILNELQKIEENNQVSDSEKKSNYYSGVSNYYNIDKMSQNPKNELIIDTRINQDLDKEHSLLQKRNLFKNFLNQNYNENNIIERDIKKKFFKNNQSEKIENKTNILNNKLGIFTFFLFFANIIDYIYFFSASFISIITGTSGAIYSYLIGYTIRIFAEENNKDYIILNLPNVMILYMTIAITFFIFNYFEFYLWNSIGFKNSYKFKKITIKNLLLQNQDFYDSLQIDDLISFCEKKFSEMKDFGRDMGNLIQNISRISSGLILALIVSWKLTLVLCGLAPIIIICNKFLGKYMIEFQINTFAKIREESYFLVETFNNIRYVQSFVNFVYNSFLYEKLLDETKKIALQNNKKIAFFFGCLFLLKYAQFPIGIYFGTYLISSNEKSQLLNTRLSASEVSIVIFCIIFIGFQVYSVLDNLNNLKIGKSITQELISLASDLIEEKFNNKKFEKLKTKKNLISFEKNDPIINEKNKCDKDQKNKNIETNKENPAFRKDKILGKIEFKNACFSFSGNPEKLILNNISFILEPGKKIGVIGERNSGKSTIVNLIQKIYKLNSGQIL